MLASLERFVRDTTLISVDPIVSKRLKYQNVVTTVKLIPDGYVLALESIVSFYYGGFIKCTPKRFSGVVFRFKDSLGTITHSIFRSGKINIAGAKTIEHARFGAQCIRQYIARVPGAYIQNGKLSLLSLVQNTIFSGFAIRLMVVSATLNRRPNLKKIMDVAPDLSKWAPDRFPGMRFLIWVRPRDKCQCESKSIKKSNNCNCTVTAILFDTGKFNLTGCKRFADVNSAVHLLNILFEDDSFISNDPLMPSHLRNKQRKELLQSDYVQFKGVNTKETKQKIQTKEFDVFSFVPLKKRVK